MSHIITVEGGSSIKLPTAGKYCDRDIVITAVGSAESYPTYEGTYDITPACEEQILFTADKILKQDIKVNQIPYAEVSNDKGGSTVTIG